MTTPTFPIERYLVPATTDPLPNATSETRVLATGLPDRVALDGDVSLVVALPTGLATAWRDADPGALVSTSAPEVAPWPPAPLTPVGDTERPPVRLIVLFRGAPVASIPLTAGLHRIVADDGNALTGALLELRIVGWELHAGSVCGAGDYGSRLRFEWLRVGAATSAFETPPLNPHVALRLRRRFRMESQLGPAVQGTAA